MKKIILAYLIIGISIASNFCQDIRDLLISGETTVINRLLCISDIRDCDISDLSIVRNSIYARYGLKFNSKDIKNYFSKYGWYKGSKNNVDSYLTKIDKANIKFIKRIESNVPSGQSINLIGIWFSTPTLADKLSTHIKFFDNGTFRYVNFEEKIYGCISVDGIWKVNTNRLEMTYLTQEVVLYDSVNFEDVLNDQYDGEKRGSIYLLPERNDYTDNIEMNEETIDTGVDKRIMQICKINGIKWYKYGSYPDEY